MRPSPTGVQRIAILRILCGHLSAFLPFFSLFRGEVSNYIAPEADLLETCPRQPPGGYFVACTAAALPPPPGFLGFAQKKEEVCSIRINRYLCDVSMRLSGQNPVGRSSKSSRAILTENLVFSVLFCQCFPKVRVKCMIQCCRAGILLPARQQPCRLRRETKDWQ